MNAKLICFLLVWPVATLAQGFAGLGTDADGFAIPTPNPVFRFPQDHGAHPDYRIEWWYVTANLKGADGTDYGLQWTLFRSALAPGGGEGWQSPQVWFAHAAVTSPDVHLADERFARGGIGQAGITAAPFAAWIDEWHLEGPDFDRLRLVARGDAFAYDMRLEAEGPLVFHGEGGYSVKSSTGQASYYYAQPHYRIEGILTLPEGDVAVSGQAWLDREWSSQPLSGKQSGWDWWALHFDDGSRLMGARVRQDGVPDFTAATWISSDGQTHAFPDGAFAAAPQHTSQVAGRDVPTQWRLTLPERNVDITVEAVNPQAWMDLSIAYWEGPVRVKGSHEGMGYMELTGYE